MFLSVLAVKQHGWELLWWCMRLDGCSFSASAQHQMTALVDEPLPLQILSHTVTVLIQFKIRVKRTLYCARFDVWTPIESLVLNVFVCQWTATPHAAGVPPFRLCSSLVHSLPYLLIFITFPPFFCSFTLLICFYCPFRPFLLESSHSVCRPEVVGGDRTWVKFVLFITVLSILLS